jgi:hypothetical protein
VEELPSLYVEQRANPIRCFPLEKTARVWRISLYRNSVPSFTCDTSPKNVSLLPISIVYVSDPSHMSVRQVQTETVGANYIGLFDHRGAVFS